MRALQPELNVVVTDMEAEARQAITDGLPEGPFTGVPFMLKDLNCPYAGVPMQNGSRFFADFIPDRDAEIVTRQKNAGLVCIAKTNTTGASAMIQEVLPTSRSLRARSPSATIPTTPTSATPVLA